jgi:hypothetical protein
MNASALVTIGIPAIALLVGGLFVLGQYVATQRASSTLVWLAGVVAWFAISAGIAASGLLGRFDFKPPPMALMFLVVISLGLWLGLSRHGERLAEALPLWLLVAVQGFRLPLELVMHQAAVEGVMPHEMSFSGYNFDIVTGAMALVIGLLLARRVAPRWLVVVWNVYGCAALVIVAAVAFLSSPMVRFFGDDPAHVNRWVTLFPFVWLPAILVTAAIAGHVIVFRKLLREARTLRAKPA